MSKIVIVTKRGIVIKFDSKYTPTQNRYGLGIKGIKLRDNDEVASAFSVEE